MHTNTPQNYKELLSSFRDYNTYLIFIDSIYEEKSWFITNQNKTLESYQKFVNDFPKSKYLEDAKKNICQIKENNAWYESKDKNTIEEYENYLKTFPKGKYKEEANIKIYQINEEMTWKDCQQQDTIQEYKNYLTKFPKGKHKEDAKKLIYQKKDEDAWYESNQKDTIQGYKCYLIKFPKGKYYENVKNQINKIVENEKRIIEYEKRWYNTKIFGKNIRKGVFIYAICGYIWLFTVVTFCFFQCYGYSEFMEYVIQGIVFGPIAILCFISFFAIFMYVGMEFFEIFSYYDPIEKIVDDIKEGIKNFMLIAFSLYVAPIIFPMILILTYITYIKRRFFK